MVPRAQGGRRAGDRCIQRKGIRGSDLRYGETKRAEWKIRHLVMRSEEERGAGLAPQ